MGAVREGDDLHEDVGHLGQLQHMLELFAHHLRPADNPDLATPARVPLTEGSVVWCTDRKKVGEAQCAAFGRWSCPGLIDADGLADYAADWMKVTDASAVCRRSYSAGLRWPFAECRRRGL
jgi:hypothetical protein